MTFEEKVRHIYKYVGSHDDREYLVRALVDAMWCRSLSQLLDTRAGLNVAKELGLI